MVKHRHKGGIRIEFCISQSEILAMVCMAGVNEAGRESSNVVGRAQTLGFQEMGSKY